MKRDKAPCVICVGGSATIDHIFLVDVVKLPCAKITARDFIETGGGMGANAAVAVQRLGGRAIYWGRVGDGQTGDEVLVRKVCRENAIGIIDFGGWLRRFHFWSEGDRDPEELLRMMDIIAERTGHGELRRVPWITFGHSTCGIFCRNVAYWKPERVAGVLHYKSGNFHQKDMMPPSGSLAGVPTLVINGQYESCGPDGIEQLEEKDPRLDRRYGRETQCIYVRSDIQKFRERDPNHLMSLILDLGGDHYFGSPELWAQAASFLRKTAL